MSTEITHMSGMFDEVNRTSLIYVLGIPDGETYKESIAIDWGITNALKSFNKTRVISSKVNHPMLRGDFEIIGDFDEGTVRFDGTYEIDSELLDKGYVLVGVQPIFKIVNTNRISQ